MDEKKEINMMIKNLVYNVYLWTADTKQCSLLS